MNHTRNTVAAVAAAAVLSLVAGCGDLEAPANDLGRSVDTSSKSPAPKVPAWDHASRMDFGDGEATLPVRPKAKTRVDRNPSRLDFGDDGRG